MNIENINFNITKMQRIVPYIGFGTPRRVTFMGTLVNANNRSKNTENSLIWGNIKNMVRNYTSKPIPFTNVVIKANTSTITALTNDKGYFEAEIYFEDCLSPGWHKAIYLYNNQVGKEIIQEEKFLVIDNKTRRAVISDIDDTIVKSYSYSFYRKLWTLLTLNESTRKINEHILLFYNHFRGELIPFFYVSNSEKNLYHYWLTMMQNKGFPPGPLLLNDHRFGLKELMFSGNKIKQHKWDKIEGLFSIFPFIQFILFGDNGQRDAFIYSRLAERYPGRILCVYIVKAKRGKIKKEYIEIFEKNNIDLIFIKNMDEALNHAMQKGLIK